MTLRTVLAIALAVTCASSALAQAPMSYGPSITAETAKKIVPAAIAEAALKQWGNKDIAFHPVGTGPFKFVEWKSTDYLKVAKFDGYWRKGYPKVDTITWKPVVDNNSRAALMQRLGFTDLVLIVIGTVIGSGIIVVPATVLARSEGTLGVALLVWLNAGV